MFKSGSTGLLNEFPLWKDLIEVDFECGSYLWLQKNAPERGYCFQETIMPAIFAVDTEHAEKFLCIITVKVIGGGGSENVICYSLCVSFGEHVNVNIFQAY